MAINRIFYEFIIRDEANQQFRVLLTEEYIITLRQQVTEYFKLVSSKTIEMPWNSLRKTNGKKDIRKQNEKSINHREKTITYSTFTI